MAVYQKPSLSKWQFAWFKPSYFILIIILTTLLGCDNQQGKTDSQLFRENAVAQAQVPLQKALNLLDDKVRQQPTEHLDSLVVIVSLLRDGVQQYESKQIVWRDDAAVIELEGFLDKVEPLLIRHAQDLMLELVDRTLLLRTQIEEAKTQPFSAKEQSTEGMVSYLAQQYNQQISDCCLQPLGQIDKILVRRAKQHRDTLVLIRRINDELENIIKDKSHAVHLRDQINKLH